MSIPPLNHLHNWIPEKMIGAGKNRLCQWLYTGERKFTEPFFTDTIATCRKLPENRKSFKGVSDFDIMYHWADETDAATLSAIIFHVSRCGSTLLSQLFSVDPTHIVLSEVPFFDELLRAPYKNELSVKEVNRYLPAAIRLYAQKRSGLEQHLFIKTDSWHIHFYEQLRELFPSTPFFLLYRDPAEVIRSQHKQRGLQSVPGLIEPDIFGLPVMDNSEHDLDGHMARVLTSYLKKMLSVTMSDPLAFAFNYADGIMNIMANMVHLCHLTPDHEMHRKWEERCRYHAKHPQQFFSEETPVKNIPAFLEPAYDAYYQLEFLRKKNMPETPFFYDKVCADNATV